MINALLVGVSQMLLRLALNHLEKKAQKYLDEIFKAEAKGKPVEKLAQCQAECKEKAQEIREVLNKINRRPI